MVENRRASEDQGKSLTGFDELRSSYRSPSSTRFTRVTSRKIRPPESSCACRNGPGGSISKSIASPWFSLRVEPLLARALHADFVGDPGRAAGQRLDRDRDDAVDDAGDVVEIA